MGASHDSDTAGIRAGRQQVQALRKRGQGLLRHPAHLEHAGAEAGGRARNHPLRPIEEPDPSHLGGRADHRAGEDRGSRAEEDLRSRPAGQGRARRGLPACRDPHAVDLHPPAVSEELRRQVPERESHHRRVQDRRDRGAARGRRDRRRSAGNAPARRFPDRESPVLRALLPLRRTRSSPGQEEEDQARRPEARGDMAPEQGQLLPGPGAEHLLRGQG